MNTLILSGHDYRSPRRASMHFIAEQLRRAGPVTFFSLGYSLISNLQGEDPRGQIRAKRNQVEAHHEVDCFLWWTPVHPFNMARFVGDVLEQLAFDVYRRAAPAVLKQMAREADLILVESGMGPLFLADLRRWSPQARIIYICSDDLSTIGVAKCVQEIFKSVAASCLDGARIPSRRLRGAIPQGVTCFYVPHGIDGSAMSERLPSPFKAPLNAVSVGSMLFDRDFFKVAGEAFPAVKFHVIGSGQEPAGQPDNVVFYPEMPFADTIAYLQNASFGIAPYKLSDVPYYLADTSMKLMQYEFLNLPAVCPTFVVGDSALRFGYIPGDAPSIISAVRAALSAKPTDSRRSYLSWQQVVSRILDPELFDDTSC